LFTNDVSLYITNLARYYEYVHISYQVLTAKHCIFGFHWQCFGENSKHSYFGSHIRTLLCRLFVVVLAIAVFILRPPYENCNVM